MTIGNTIHRLRSARGMTQVELAKIAGVTDKAVSTWENGTSIPRMGAIEKIAAHFGVTKAYLMGEAESDAVTFPPLTPDEGELLDCYRALNPSGQGVLLTTARAFASNPEMQKSADSSETA